MKKDLQKEGNHAKIPFCVEEQRPPVNFPLEEVFGLPNIKSQARNARNKANRSALKTAIKKFEAAAAEGKRTEAEGAYKAAVKMVDQSVRKGVLHKNNAAHKKSAMTLKLSKI